MSDRRRPNPWIAIPSLAMGGLIGWVTYLVIDVTCRAESETGTASCTGLASSLGVVGGILGTLGMAVVLVLVYRSLAEHKAATDRGEEPPGPGCETGAV